MCENMSTAWGINRNVAFLLGGIFASFLLSPQLFVGLSFLLGAVLVGLLVEGKWFSFVALTAGYVMLLNVEGVFSGSVIYPILFSLLVFLLWKGTSSQEKGTIFFWVTVIMAILAAFALFLLEKKGGFLTLLIEETKEEIGQMTLSLRGLFTEKELKELSSYAVQLLERYHIFFALLQIVFFNSINFILLPYLFDNLPETFSQPFYRLQIPYYGIWGINIALFFYLFKTGRMALYALNVVLFFMTIYFVQGLSLSLAFFKRYNFPPLFSTALLMIFLMNQAMWFLLSVAGILDAQFNIKKFLKEA